MRFITSLALVFIGISCLAVQSAEHVKMGQYLGAKDTVYPGWFKSSFLDFNDDVAEAAEEGKRVMIIFHQDNCPYCNALVERNLSQRDIEEKLKADFDVIAMNMWGDREVATVDGKTYTEKSFSEALKVQFTPTILILNEQGKLALRLNGYLPPSEFKLALDYAADSTKGQKGYREFLAANRPEKPTGELVAADFFSKEALSLRQEGEPLALFFEQRDCPLCEQLHAKVLSEEDSQTELKKFRNLQMDMWGNNEIVLADGKKVTARELAASMNVKYAPTIVLLNTKGEEIIRSEAMFKTFHTQSMFDYVSSGEYKNWPNFQRYISDRAEKIRETGKDVDIWK